MTIWNIDFSDIDWEYCDPEPADQPVIDALHQLRTVDAEYPPDLLAARRAGFVAEIQKRNACPECNGRGYSWSEFSLQDEPCDECGGTGHALYCKECFVYFADDSGYCWDCRRKHAAADPDAVDIPTPPVSEHQDERNSRPFPF